MRLKHDSKETLYVLTYLPTGKKYVGKTCYEDGGKMRLRAHIGSLKRGKHSSKLLQADYNKFGGGEESFKIECVGEMWWSEKCNAKYFDAEKMLMLRLKTYDNRYGYNAQDPSMKRWLRKCRMYSAIA